MKYKLIDPNTVPYYHIEVEMDDGEMMVDDVVSMDTIRKALEIDITEVKI